MWECRGCEEALKVERGRGPWRNPMSANKCLACDRTWKEGAALAEKLAKEKGGSASGQMNTALDKAKEAVKVAAQKNKGTYLDAARAATSEGTGEDMAVDLVEAERRMKISLTQEYLAVDGRLKLPKDMEETWSAAECFAKFLPKQAKLEVDQLQEELADLQQRRKFQEKKLSGTTAADAVETKKRISTLEKQIEKAGDGTSKAALQACEYEVARRKYEEVIEHRTARADAAAERVRESSNRLEEICSEQLAGWESMLEKARADRAYREEAWDERRQLKESHTLEVITLANEKMEAAKLKAGVAASPPSSSTPSINLELLDAKAEVTNLKQAAEKGAAAMEELKQEALKAAELAKTEHQALLARLTALEKATATPPQTEQTARLTDKAYSTPRASSLR